MSDLNIGLKLANRYELLEPLGQGSMGRVYLAEDMLLGSVKVAVKFLSQTLLSDKMRDRFMQEAMTCALLGQQSIHVVRVTDYGVSEDGIPFYVMEYLQGQSLSHLININPLPLPRFLGLIRQLCLGFQAAHDGIILKTQPYPVPIIHRDIKPSNIMIVQDQTLGELAKILDFGVAKLIQSGSDQTHCFMGTLAYASPEQMEGRELDNRSDIYSFGVMMFQMLTGHLPLRASNHTFGGWYQVHLNQTPKSISAVTGEGTVPKLLDDLVMQCLAKRPEDRPQQVRDILQALKPLETRFVPGLQISQRIGTTLNRLPVKRQPLWAMMPQEEISRRLVSTRYNTFICTMSPHPMMLWLTVLYSSTHGARWLPCYVDLKSAIGQQIAGLLKDTGTYKLLLFALESPGGCSHVLTCTIAGPQRGMLQEWALTAQTRPSVGAASTSRDILRNEFKTKLKEKVLQKLESIYVDTGSNLAE